VFQTLEKRVQQAFESHIPVRYGVAAQVALEQPKQAEFGELAVPVAFQLAKQLRQAPKKIAQELVSEIGPIEGVAAMEVAGAGYINIRFDRAAYGWALLGGGMESAPPAAGRQDHRRAHQYQSQ
jgi:arginyl-tRNA synthetase